MFCSYKLVKVRLLKSTILIVAFLIVVVDCLDKKYLLDERRKISILTDPDPEVDVFSAQQSAAQVVASENCVCVFHYSCDRNYNLITNGDGIIDERIGPSEPAVPPQTQCPSPGQICCRLANGTAIPTNLPPVVSPSSAPDTTAAPATTVSTTTTPAPTTTARQGSGENPVITLPPGTVIILPTSLPPATPPPATIPTVPPTAAPTTAAPTTAAPTTAAPTTAAPTTTTAAPTTAAPTTAAPTTPVPPTAAPATTAASGSPTAAPATTAAPAPATSPRPIMIPTLPPPLTPTPSPMTIPTVPPSTLPPTTLPPTTAGSTPPTTLPPTTAGSTPPTPPTTNPTVVFPTTPPIVFPPTNASTTVPAAGTTAMPPVVFPTTNPATTVAPPPATTARPATTAAPPTTAAPATTAALATTAAPATTARPTAPPLGPPGSQCGVRYIQPGQSETLEPYSTSFGEFPWMLAVLDTTAVTVDGTVVRNAFVAGASLITRNIALTGAHRLKNFTNNPSSLIVRAGEWNTVTANEPLPHQDRTVQRIEVHQDFNNRTLFNDIALLKLEEPVVFANNVVQICLPVLDQQFTGPCVATGWGQNAFGPTGQYQRIMRKVTLPIVDRVTCQAQFRNNTRLGFGFMLDPSFICAGGQPNLDTCTGDGGGPLVCPIANGTYIQAGIVSWGIGCGMNNVPGVYVSVSYLREWINSTMARLNLDTVPRFSASRK